MEMLTEEMMNTRTKTVCNGLQIRKITLISYHSAISSLFSGEEAYGKYLDLYAHHAAYNNLKNIGKRPGYLQYLDLLLTAQSGTVHRDLSKETKFAKNYES